MPDTLESTAVQPVQPLTDTDWNAVKTAYLQGTPLADIGAAHGLSVHQIRNKAWRNGWRNESLADASSVPSAYQDLVREWQENMAVTVLARSKYYANSDIIPISLRENKDLESAIQAHIDSGRKLFGLDRAESGNGNAWHHGNVIDVTATAVTLKHDTKS